MKSIQVIIACLIIFTIVISAGCDKFESTVADMVNEASKELPGFFSQQELNSPDDDSLFTVEGVRLKYTVTVILKEAYKGSELILDESTASIDLTGTEAKETDLMITCREYAEGDASFSIVDSVIKGKTKSGKPYLITNIKGKIPRNLNLNINDGAGAITLTDMQDNGKVTLETGAGNITLQSCKIKVVSTTTGAGGIFVTDSQIDKMAADVGAGNITLKNSKVTKRNFETGIGRVIEL